MCLQRWLACIAVFAISLSVGTPAHAQKDVSFNTTDDVTIHGSLYGEGAKGVLLIHDEKRSQKDWDYFAKKLEGLGFLVLAIDLRGHGQSTLEAGLVTEDYPKMVQDVQAAKKYLIDNGATRVALIGARFGANLALATAAEDENVTQLILLSPGLTIRGVKLGSFIDSYGKRSLLLVYGEDDTYGAKTASFVQGRSTGEVHIEGLENAGKGVTMLNRDPDLEGILVSYLSGSFKLVMGDGSERKTVGNTGDASDIETTGKKFGED